MRTWPVDVELVEARRELARERFALLMHERADADGRVADRDVWLVTLGRSRSRVAELRSVVAAYEMDGAA